MKFDPAVEIAILRNLLTQTSTAYEEQMVALQAEKELAQVTLASIGDGVVTIGDNGLVKYLNPVAETLAAVSTSDAAGHPISIVFRIVHESSGAPFEIPLVDRTWSSGDDPKTRNLMLVRPSGERLSLEFRVAPIHDRTGGRIGHVIVLRDVSEQRIMSLQLLHGATHDALTGVLNRTSFDSHLRLALATPPASGRQHALCYLDLDQFKLINDTLGHLAGDRLLQEVAMMIVDEIRETNLLARLGGDEFGLLLLDCTHEEALAFADHVLYTFRGYSFEWESKTLDVTASIGLVPITPDYLSVDELMSAADHACYTAKDKGRDRVQLFQRDDVDMVRRHDEMDWVVRIGETLEHGRLRLYGQRIMPINAPSSSGYAFEVLVRVMDADGRILLPGDVIRAAERYGLMARIDRWVVTEALRFLSSRHEGFLDTISFVSINLSAVSLREPSMTDFLRDAINASGVPPEKICFELTETATIENMAVAAKLMHDLRRMRCRFALDDFGAGMSSLRYLRELPVDFIKIDGRFVNDIVTDTWDLAMVEAIHQMARVIGIETVAESVTGGDVLDRLRTIGISYGQGYWFGFPRPLEDLFGAHSAAGSR